MGKNKMDYRDILGFSKKQPKKKVEKRVAPKPTVPPVTELLKKEFGSLNEWSEVDTGPKRWFKKMDEEGLTEFEKSQMNEGPAYEYANAFSKFEKAYMQLQKATDELGSFVTKKTGEKVDQKIFEKQWKKQVTPFYKLMKSWIRGKM
jgi:hypothetical protein